MSNNINPINIGSRGINFHQPRKEETEKNLATEKEVTQQPNISKELSADDILNHLSASSMAMKPVVKKSLDISKYVTPEQAERIAGFVTSFEGEVTKGLKRFDVEFGAKSLSDNAKLELVVEQFNKIYM